MDNITMDSGKLIMDNAQLPKGWVEKKLGEVCEIQLGKTPHRKTERFWDKNKETSNVWISIADMKHGLTLTDSKEYISNLGAENIRIIPKGTLMLSFKLTLGRVSFAGKDLYSNEAIASLINLKNEIDIRFLYFYFTFFDWNKETEGDKKVKGRTLNKEKLRNLKLIIPPLTQQKQIVKILDQAFTAIELAKNNAQQNLLNAKQLFESYLQNVFVNGKLKVESGEWVEKRLDEITEVKDGTHDSPKYISDGIPFVTQKNIKKEGFNISNTKFITEIDHQKFYKRSNVAFEDILISMIGANRGMSAIVDIKDVFSIKNVGLIKKSDNINQLFLLFYLQSTLAMKYIKLMSNGGAQEFIGLRALRAFPIPFPKSKEEQQKIVKKLNALQAQTKKLETIYEQKIIDLEELKSAFLQKAFNGQLLIVND